LVPVLLHNIRLEVHISIQFSLGILRIQSLRHRPGRSPLSISLPTLLHCTAGWSRGRFQSLWFWRRVILGLSLDTRFDGCFGGRSGCDSPLRRGRFFDGLGCWFGCWSGSYSGIGVATSDKIDVERCTVEVVTEYGPSESKEAFTYPGWRVIREGSFLCTCAGMSTALPIPWRGSLPVVAHVVLGTLEVKKRNGGWR